MRRTSSITRGRSARIASVCHRIVIASSSRSVVSRRSRGERFDSSSSWRHAFTTMCLSRTFWRVISVGCAVATSSTAIRSSTSWTRSAGTPRAAIAADRGGQALGLRPPLGLALGVARPAAAHAVVLLGRVDELEVDREGADDARLERDVEAVDDPLHLRLARVRVGALRVGAQRPVQQPEPLLDVQQLLPALLHQHPPEEVPEQADVAAEGLIAVVVAGGRGHAVVFSPRPRRGRGPRSRRG